MARYISDTQKFLQNLHEDDEVTYHDPDDGICSGQYKVLSVDYKDPKDPEYNRYTLQNLHGSILEAFGYELS